MNLKIDRVPWSPFDDVKIEGSIIIGRLKILINDVTVINAFEIDATNGKTLAVWYDRLSNSFVTASMDSIA
jgi:hypothetical protein